MTTIIFRKTPNAVQIGFDSKVSFGRAYEETPDPKVFVSGDLVIGVSGLLKDGNLLRYADLPQFVDGDVARYVTNTLTPAILEVLRLAGSVRVENEVVGTESHLLVAVNGEVFEIESNGGWARNTKGVYAIGSGSRYALGALAAGASMLTALEIAAAHDSGTGGTLTVTTAAELLHPSRGPVAVEGAA